jgi:hypothetical protein
MGHSSSGRHLLEIGSFKDSRRRLFFFMKSVACKKKAFACNKKHLPAILFCASIFWKRLIALFSSKPVPLFKETGQFHHIYEKSLLDHQLSGSNKFLQ